jgi:hypothetical protein
LQQAPTIIILTFALTIVGSVILTWLFNSTSGSILVGVVFHTILNTGSVVLLPGSSQVEVLFLLTVIILGIFAGFLFTRRSFASFNEPHLVPA